MLARVNGGAVTGGTVTINNCPVPKRIHTDKKEKKILICKEIQSGSGAMSYMRKGFLIYEGNAQI